MKFLTALFHKYGRIFLPGGTRGPELFQARSGVPAPSRFMNGALRRSFYILVVLAPIFSLIALKYLRPPYGWIDLDWFVVTLCATLLARKAFSRALWLNVSVIVITLATFEFYLWGHTHKLRVENHDTRFISRSEVLGYAPIRNGTRVQKAYLGDQLLYDATYTIDSNGLRIGPVLGGSDKLQEGVLFFGCSFTFGVGVDDNQTMPYLVGKLSHGEYRTYNFGFPGYGPHQMLAQLENRTEEGIPGCKPKFAVYQAICAHVERAIGKASYDLHGPRYSLKLDGQVGLTGHFDDMDKGVSFAHALALISNELEQSLIVQRIERKHSYSNNDIDLYVRIVDAARTVFESRYPGSRFYVIFWDDAEHKDKTTNAILNGLYAKGIRVHLISRILPDLINSESKYQLNEYDGHPNPLAYELIAKYLVEKVLAREDRHLARPGAAN